MTQTIVAGLILEIRFGWTGFTSSIHWMSPIAASVLIGFGILCIFLPCFNYLIDAYLPL
jgi:DHA1 family multidrug resistance protein-like MFS transporter